MIAQSQTTLHRQSFTKGERVQLHPATEMGDRYGNVVHVGRKLVHVLMDGSNKIRKIHPSNVMHVD